METIDEILREMINLAHIDKESDEKIPRKHMASALSGYAHRIDVAVKALVADRDNCRKQALEEDNRANLIHSVTNCNQFKMREALEEISNLADAIYTNNECANENSLAILSMCDKALSAHPRNCDVYTEAQLCETVTEEIKSEFFADIPQGIIDIVEIVAKGVIKGLYVEAKGEQK